MSIPWNCTTCGGLKFDDTFTFSAHTCPPPVGWKDIVCSHCGNRLMSICHTCEPPPAPPRLSFADRLKQNQELVDDLISQFERYVCNLDCDFPMEYDTAELRALILTWADFVEAGLYQIGQKTPNGTILAPKTPHTNPWRKRKRNP